MSPTLRYLLETSLGLLVLVAVGVAVVWWARQKGMGTGTGPMQLVARLRLDPGRAVYLVRVGETVLVLGASESGLSKLGEIPAAELPEDAAEIDSPLVLPFLKRALRDQGSAR